MSKKNGQPIVVLRGVPELSPVALRCVVVAVIKHLAHSKPKNTFCNVSTKSDAGSTRRGAPGGAGGVGGG